MSCCYKMNWMKKLLLSFFSAALIFNSNAQVKKRYNRPFIGVNFGATWQQSDVRDIARSAGGLTFGKYYRQNETNLFDFGWRFRYLHGATRGMDLKRNANIKSNPVFNDNPNFQLNYADSLGYVFNNYRMNFDEFAFELMLGLNKLREKTRIVLYAFGGAGISGWQTKINQLDANGKMYEYDLLGPTPSLSAMNAFLDKTYETNADGNSKYRFRFVPSFGLGLGWQTRRGHYIGMEHRITCTLTDRADGVKQSGGGFLQKNDDFYHYSGVFVRWLIGGVTSTYHTTEPSGNNPPPPPLPTYTSTVYNPPPPPPPPPSNNKPSVIINYPTFDPFKTGSNMITIKASVFNVGSKNDITIKVNGYSSQNFTYDMVTKVLSVTSLLNPGNNSFYILAVNPYGSEGKSVNVIYEQNSIPSSQKPVITITNPFQNPFTTYQNSITVTATVQNINSKNELTAYVNNVPIGAFVYDANTKTIQLTTTLNAGTNTIQFNATNQYGSDSKTQTVFYQKDSPSRPIVTITSPIENPYNTSSSSIVVHATVANVNSQNEISVIVNGLPVQFSYDVVTKNLMVANNNLMTGNNVFTITASNASGSDSKSVTVVYASRPNELPPLIILINPTDNPYTAKSTNITVTALIHNITSKNNLSVTINGMPSTNFSYNSNSKLLSVSSLLNQGTNTFVVSAANSAGNDSKTLTVIYNPREQGEKPVITITNPTSNPFNTSSSTITINATVFNVASQSEIAVFVNNKSFSNFTYNPSSKILSFNSALNQGSNSFLITASNINGTDSKNLTINYTKKTILPKPVVNIITPSSNPYSTSQANVDVTAMVQNVNSKDEITVKVNNILFSNFQYSHDSKTISFNAALNLGSNTIIVSALNQGGSDSKSITVNYVKPISFQLPKPVVTITYPSSSPFLSNSQSVNVAAKVLNVTSKNDINVSGPSGAITDFTYDHTNGTVSVRVNLGKGDNVITITGTNLSGSDSKSVTLKFQPIVQPSGGIGVNPKGGGQKPVVTFINPSTTPSTVTSQFLEVKATVLHVTKNSEIKIVVNGNDVSNFAFDSATRMVTFSVTLGLGVLNNITITGTNIYGSDSKTVVVTVSQ